MSLVNYSSSSDEDDQNGLVAAKHSEDDSDKNIVRLQNTLHDGRVRSFPHEDGNWATYVFIPFPLEEGLVNLRSEIKHFVKATTGLCLENISHHHVSLTKTIALKRHWIEPFTNSVKRDVENYASFLMLLDSVKIYCNEERTRTFVSLSVARQSSRFLEDLVRIMDKNLTDYNLPLFYENLDFHVSILWCLGDESSNLNVCINHIKQLAERFMEEDETDFVRRVGGLSCKSGNKMFYFPFNGTK